MHQYAKANKDVAVNNRVKGYIHDLKNLASVEKAFLKTIQQGRLFHKHISYVGKNCLITGIQDRNLILKLTGTSGTINLKWDQIPAATRFQLMLKNLPLDHKNYMALATFCLAQNLSDEVHNVLITILKSAPQSKKEVDTFYARWLEIPVPQPSGFIIKDQHLLKPE